MWKLLAKSAKSKCICQLNKIIRNVELNFKKYFVI